MVILIKTNVRVGRGRRPSRDVVREITRPLAPVAVIQKRIKKINRKKEGGGGGKSTVTKWDEFWFSLKKKKKKLLVRDDAFSLTEKNEFFSPLYSVTVYVCIVFYDFVNPLN